MQRKILQPEQIIVPGEYELRNESVLKIYFRVYDNGHGEDLPPVIVVNNLNYKDQLPPVLENKRILAKIEQSERELNDGTYGKSYQHCRTPDVIKRLEQEEASHIQKCRAHQKRCFEKDMEIYADIIEKTENLIAEGAKYFLVDGNHKSAATTLTHQPIQSLEIQTDADLEEIRRMVERGELFDFNRAETIVDELVAAFYEYCVRRLDEFSTVRQRIDLLTANDGLPEYMKDRYLRGK